MTCDEKTIAPWQTLIKGKVEFVGTTTSKNGYSKEVIRCIGGPEKFQQYFEIEFKTAAPDLKKGDEISALCWCNSREWNGMVFSSFALIHVEVIPVVPTEANPVQNELDMFNNDDDMDVNEIF